jgi:Transposase DDE domain
VDRRKPGSKHHLITCGRGNPLAAESTAANVNDINRFVPLVDAVPPVRGRRGRPRQRPGRVYGDRAYHSRESRREPRRRKVKVRVARPTDPHGSGLGRPALGGRANDRLASPLPPPAGPLRAPRRHHQALLTIGCCLICFKQLQATESL